jgi:hypothetical protein
VRIVARPAIFWDQLQELLLLDGIAAMERDYHQWFDGQEAGRDSRVDVPLTQRVPVFQRVPASIDVMCVSLCTARASRNICGTC